MNKLIWVAIAFLSGAFLPLQAGLNARMGKASGNAVYASMFSFAVGIIGLLLYIVLTRQQVSWAGVREAPAYAWIAGLLGAFYVTVIVLAFPKLGPGLTFGLVVAGQMLMSVLLEHYNILVAQQTPMNYMKLLGILLIVGGVIIIRKF